MESNGPGVPFEMTIHCDHGISVHGINLGFPRQDSLFTDHEQGTCKLPTNFQTPLHIFITYRHHTIHFPSTRYSMNPKSNSWYGMERHEISRTFGGKVSRDTRASVLDDPDYMIEDFDKQPSFGFFWCPRGGSIVANNPTDIQPRDLDVLRFAETVHTEELGKFFRQNPNSNIDQLTIEQRSDIKSAVETKLADRFDQENKSPKSAGFWIERDSHYFVVNVVKEKETLKTLTDEEDGALDCLKLKENGAWRGIGLSIKGMMDQHRNSSRSAVSAQSDESEANETRVDAEEGHDDGTTGVPVT